MIDLDVDVDVGWLVQGEVEPGGCGAAGGGVEGGAVRQGRRDQTAQGLGQAARRIKVRCTPTKYAYITHLPTRSGKSSDVKNSVVGQQLLVGSRAR